MSGKKKSTPKEGVSNQANDDSQIADGMSVLTPQTSGSGPGRFPPAPLTGANVTPILEQVAQEQRNERRSRDRRSTHRVSASRSRSRTPVPPTLPVGEREQLTPPTWCSKWPPEEAV